MEKEFYTVPELSKLIKKDQAWIKRLCQSGRIKAKKIGRDWLISDYSGALNLERGNPNFGKKKR